MSGCSGLQREPLRFPKLQTERFAHWGAAESVSKPLIVVAVCKHGKHKSVATGEMAKEVLHDHPETGVVELDHLCRRFGSPNGCPFNGCAQFNVNIRSELREVAKHKAMIIFRECFE